MPKCYNEIYNKGEAYLVDGRIARYWGTDLDKLPGQRRMLVFFDVKTDACIEVDPRQLRRIRRLGE